MEERVALTAVLIPLVVLGCGTYTSRCGGAIGCETVLERSSEALPNWVQERPDDDRHYAYYRGVAVGESLPEARERAYLNALSRIVRSLGIAVSVSLEGDGHAPALRFTEDATEVATYWEKKFTVVARWDSVAVSYTVWVLVRYPRRHGIESYTTGVRDDRGRLKTGSTPPVPTPE
jgi:hypothetical protein